MKKTQLALTLAALTLLSACGNTLAGIRADISDSNHWAHNRPSALEKTFGRAPSGYTRFEAPAAPALKLRPPSPVAVKDAPVLVSSRGVTPIWNTLDDYDARSPSLPSVGGDVAPLRLTAPKEDGFAPRASFPGRIQVNRNVDVYPVTGSAAVDAPAGSEMVQQIYFGNGSTAVRAIDQRNLRELGQSLRRYVGHYQITVIGHASGTGNAFANGQVAQKRAEAVASVLRRSGVKAGRVTAISAGAEDAGPSDEASRRVDVFLNAN